MTQSRGGEGSPPGSAVTLETSSGPSSLPAPRGPLLPPDQTHQPLNPEPPSSASRPSPGRSRVNRLRALNLMPGLQSCMQQPGVAQRNHSFLETGPALPTPEDTRLGMMAAGRASPAAHLGRTWSSPGRTWAWLPGMLPRAMLGSSGGWGEASIVLLSTHGAFHSEPSQYRGKSLIPEDLGTHEVRASPGSTSPPQAMTKMAESQEPSLTAL